MNQITMQKLIDIFRKDRQQTIDIQLEGIINLNMIIENVEINCDSNYIMFFSAKNEEQKVSFNIYQIMKIEEVNFKYFEFKFDFFQVAKMRIK